MFCSKCGKKLPDDSKFCSGCGATLVNNTRPVSSKTSSYDREYALMTEKTDKQLRTAMILGIIGSAVYLISLFTEAYSGVAPFVGQVSVSMTRYMQGGATGFIWITAILGVVFAVLHFGVLQVLTGLACGGLGVIAITHINEIANNDTVSTSIGKGPYLMFLGAILIVVSGIMNEVAKDSMKKFERNHSRSSKTNTSDYSEEKVDYVDVYCPNCNEKLSYTSAQVKKGGKLTCPHCSDSFEYSKELRRKH